MHFSLPSVPSIPPTLHTPCLPVSLGNLQLKASHPHGSMYPSNKKKKVWREEKGNRPRGPGDGRRVGGGGGPAGRRVALRPQPPRALSAGAAPARGRVHARARRRPRATPGHLRLAHLWAHTPPGAGSPPVPRARLPAGAHPPGRVQVGQDPSWDFAPPAGCPADGCQPVSLWLLLTEHRSFCTCLPPVPASVLPSSQSGWGPRYVQLQCDF